MAGKRARKNEPSQSFAKTFQKLLEEKPDLEELGEAAAQEAGTETRDELIAMSLIRKAMQGDLSAAKFIREVVGETEKETACKPERFTITLRVREDKP